MKNMGYSFEGFLPAHDRNMALFQIKEANELFVEFNNYSTPALRIKGQQNARDLVLHYIVKRHPAK